MTSNPPLPDLPDGAEPSGPAPTYTVGYRKPPVHSRVKPGEVLNPRGRPKGQRNSKTVFNELLGERITFREGDRPRSMSKRDAMYLRMINAAVSGNDKAQSKVLALQAKYEEREDIANQEPLTADDEALVAEFLQRHGDQVKPTPSPENNQRPQAGNGNLANEGTKS
jgi:Family of unknown function (DUF5681)